MNAPHGFLRLLVGTYIRITKPCSYIATRSFPWNGLSGHVLMFRSISPRSRFHLHGELLVTGSLLIVIPRLRDYHVLYRMKTTYGDCSLSRVLARSHVNSPALLTTFHRNRHINSEWCLRSMSFTIRQEYSDSYYPRNLQEQSSHRKRPWQIDMSVIHPME